MATKHNGDTDNRPKATKHTGDTDNRPKAVKLIGDTINRPKPMKLIGGTISRPMAMKHTGDTDNRPKAVKRSGDTINRPKATKRTGDTDNLRNDAKYAVRPNGNPVGLFFHRVGDEKLAKARSRYGTLPCPFRKSYPGVFVMQPSQDRNCDNGARSLDCSVQGRIFL